MYRQPTVDIISATIDTGDIAPSSVSTSSSRHHICPYCLSVAAGLIAQKAEKVEGGVARLDA